MVLLIAILGGLVFVYLRLTAPAVATGSSDVSPGFRHIKSIYAYGPGAENLFVEPFGVAYVDGRLYVGQQGKGNVIVLDAGGRYLRTIGTKGMAPGQLSSPGGLDVDRQGTVYVSDPSHGKLVVYGPDGRLVKELPVRYALTPRVADGQNLYLTTFDSVNHYALPSFEQLSVWGGKRGRGATEWDFPNGLAVADGGDAVYVADSNNMRLKKLDRGGQTVWTVGQPPSGLKDQNRVFGLPGGMVLVDGVLYIADPLNGVIHLYRTDGTKIGEVGEPGPGEGQFSYPSQIAHLGGRRFAVTEWGNDRVQIVEIDPGGVQPGGTAVTQ